MGSPLGPVLANIFMCDFEEKWVMNNGARPTIWFRYVDDTFTLFHNKDAAVQFLSYLNTRHKNIQFTIEFEQNQEIPFLDVLIKRHLNNSFSTSIYRKKTFTGLYTQWDSFTPRKYKINLIRTLTYRCLRICSSPCLLQSALDDLRRHLSRNGYPRGIISYNMNDVVNKHQNKPKDMITVPKKEIFIVLPYLGIQSKIVTQQLKSCIYKFYGCFNLKIIFRNTRRIKSFFPYKDKLNRSLKSKVVYKASCWDCNDYYIGKTKRRLHDRKTEHFKALTNNSHSSAIADHMTQTGHRIKWDHFDILATGQSDIHCKIKEALLIRDLKPALNENIGSEKLLLY